MAEPGFSVRTRIWVRISVMHWFLTDLYSNRDGVRNALDDRKGRRSLRISTGRLNAGCCQRSTFLFATVKHAR